jgi:hypothetical protein
MDIDESVLISSKASNEEWIEFNRAPDGGATLETFWATGDAEIRWYPTAALAQAALRSLAKRCGVELTSPFYADLTAPGCDYSRATVERREPICQQL